MAVAAAAELAASTGTSPLDPSRSSALDDAPFPFLATVPVTFPTFTVIADSEADEPSQAAIHDACRTWEEKRRGEYRKKWIRTEY